MTTAGENPTPETVAVAQESIAVPHHAARSDGPADWARKNLFNNWYNSAITVILGVLLAWIGYRLSRFVFVTGQWNAVSKNLELFMVGTFPREERWRLIAQVILLGGAVGAGVGSLRESARETAEETGEPWTPTPTRELVASYWAAALFVVVTFAAFVRTVGPVLVLLATIAAAVVARQLCVMLPSRFRAWGWTLAAVLGVAQLQVVTGTGGLAFAFMTLALVPLVSSEGLRLLDARPRLAVPAAAVGAIAGAVLLALRTDLLGLAFLAVGLFGLFSALRGDRIDGGRTGIVVVVALILLVVFRTIGLTGVDWAEWGGFHLNLVLTPIAIGLAFPMGILLALGRRSKLAAVRVMSVAYIEFFRGAPLITFLLAGQFFLGFFLDSDTPLSLITRAAAALTLFTAAYIAEIVRGGLQAVHPGQIEAGQAMGLSQAKVMRLIVLPQALRAVIPAMVGQFISLFKDTSLLSILGITELLDARGLVHGQAEFRGQGIGETLIFVAFGFWFYAFTMSRESQRLERRLRVGVR